MSTSSRARSAVRGLAASAGLAVGAYAAYVAVTWFRYGRTVHASNGDQSDELLDRFMPTYEVAERHHVRVSAPAAVTLAAACDMPLLDLPLVRVLVKARAFILGAAPDDQTRPSALLAQVQSIGWGVLGETPGREILVGAVTKPWEANVVFRALAPDEFAAFHEPGYAKIVWTLRADPIGENESIFRTETRVATTDPVSRAKFRRYWAFLSPGILLIRWSSLRPLKAEAERRSAIANDPSEAWRVEP